MKHENLHSDIERLLEHTGWVRRLVGGLVADPAWREDVAQEAWLAAMAQDRSQVRDGKRWLRTVVLNVVRQSARAEARRRRREREAAREESLPSAGELIAQADLQRRVVASLLELGEPLRTTLLLRYFRGHSSAEIGRAQGLPASTVRDRIQRGLDALRRRFDGECETRRDRGRRLALLLALPESPLPRVAVFGGGTAYVVMTAAAIAGVLLWYSLFRTRSADALQPQAPTQIEVASAVGQEPVLELEQAQRPRLERVAAPQSNPPLQATEHIAFGRVVDSSGAGIEAALVTVADFPRLATSPASIGLAARTNALGEYLLPGHLHDRPGLVLVAEHPGYAPQLVGMDRAAEVVLRRAARVHGSVRDAESGLALAGVRVTTYEFDWFEGDTRRVTTDAAGRFELPAVPRGETLQLGLSAPGCARRVRRVAVPDVDRLEGVELTLDRGVALQIEVRDQATGGGLTAARIQVDFADVGSTGPSGFLRVGGIHAGEPHALGVSRMGYCPAQFELPTDLPRSELTVTLVRECVVEGIVRDAEGGPIPYAPVRLAGGTRAPAAGVDDSQGLLADGSLPSGLTRTTCDAHGRFRLDQLPPWTRWEATVASDPRTGRSCRGASVNLDHPGSRARVELLFPPTPSSVRGVVCVNGEPVAATISWRGSSTAGKGASDASGAFFLAALEPGPLELVFDVESRGLEHAHEVQLVAHETWLEIDIASELALLAGRVVHANGSPAVGQEVSAFDPDRTGPNSKATTGSDGTFRMWVRTTPGADLKVRSRHGPLFVTEFPVPAGTRDMELILPQLGWLSILVPGQAGSPAPREITVAYRLGSEGSYAELPRYAVEPSGEGAWVIRVPTGRLDLRVRAIADGPPLEAVSTSVLVTAVEASDPVTVLLESSED